MHQSGRSEIGRARGSQQVAADRDTSGVVQFIHTTTPESLSAATTERLSNQGGGGGGEKLSRTEVSHRMHRVDHSLEYVCHYGLALGDCFGLGPFRFKILGLGLCIANSQIIKISLQLILAPAGNR
jgi:hypothetical protein